jgi:type I restriction enzyme S subunit
MKETNTLIPELRFPEFLNEGEWEYTKLDNYIELFSGIALKSEELSDDKLGIPILRGINITEGYIRHSKEIDKYYLGDIEKLKNYLIKENDIVIGMDGSKVGKNVALIKKEDENSILIQRVARIRTNKKANIFYIYQHVLSEKFIKYVDTVNTSSGIPHISAQQIKEFKIGFPSIFEQQKIASCLSSLDDVITAHSQKLEALKGHKKGLMQNLFPQDGERVPKWRFPEFLEDGEWLESELENFCFNISSGKDKNTIDGEFELYGSTGIIGKSENASYDGDYILVARVGANAGLLNRVKGKFGVTDNTLVIDLRNIAFIEFLFYSLEKIGLNKLVFGSGQPLITGGQLKSQKLIIPKSETEQQKIASCLSTLDELIAAQVENIEQLKRHKKGLMQGLFPMMERG